MALNISTSTVFAAGEIREFVYSSTEYEGNHGISLDSSAYGSALVLTNRGVLKFTTPASADRASLIFATSGGAWWDGVIENYGSMSMVGGSVSLLWASWTPQVINAGEMTVDGDNVSLIQGDQVKGQGEDRPSLVNSGEMIATGANGAVGVRFSYASTIVNSGLLTAVVLAGGKDAALTLMVGDGSIIRNVGQIIAEDNDPGTARATAIGFAGSDGPALIVNNGLIKGDIAIRESNLLREYTGYALSRVENYKDIVGKIVLGLGDDTVVNRGLIDGDVELGDQNDIYDGAGGHVTGVVRGGAGSDRFSAGTGSELFEGGSGDDTFFPGTGSATFDGGAGVDTADYSSLGAAVTVSLAAASAQAGVQLLNVEAIVGSAYADTLLGDTGDNVFRGGGGDDAIDGGAGKDTAVYQGASYDYSWTQVSGGTWTIKDLRAGAADGVDALKNIEQLKFSDAIIQVGGANAINGSAGNDHIRATSADDVIDGGAGIDTVEYRGASTDFSITQSGDGSWTIRDLRVDHPEGADTLRNVEQLKFSDKLLVIGSAPPNVINGTSGSDYLYGTNANDVIDGGADRDTVEYRGASSDFSLTQGGDGSWTVKDLRSESPEGTDILKNVEQIKFSDKLVVIVEPTPNVILGTDAGDNLYGTNGNDIIRGGAGDDFIYGSPADDTFDGGDGRDQATFIASPWGVRVDLAVSGAQNTGDGIDTFVSIESLMGSAYNDIFYGDSDANIVNGYYGNDQLDGRDGDDAIGGDGGNDIIRGGAGNDSLSGGSGDDAVYGDAGDDSIVLASERVGVDPGRDIIDGGDGIDTLRVVFTDFGVDINLSITTPQIIGPGIDLVVRNVENLFGWEFADHLTGDAHDNVIVGYDGDDVIDGGAGVDTVEMRGYSTDYAVTWTLNGWQIADKRPYVAPSQLGSSSIYDGVDTVRNVEFIKYYDKTVALGDGMPFVVGNILRQTGASATATDLSARLGSGAISAAQAVSELVTKAGATTSVATLAYEFFTGKIPGQAGIDYLVSPTGPNGNNLNSAYYQSFNLENRYINFAVNLGKNGEGSAKFAADYGSLSLFDATRKAYAAIFGGTPTDAKVHAMIDPRADYFAYYGGDGANGVGTKAAMVGWLLAEAQKADVGVMVKSNDAWLTDLADGSAPFAIDILDPAKGYYKADFVFGG